MKENRKCGHELTDSLVPNNGSSWWCDGCKCGCKAGERVHGCRPCNFDLCTDCYINSKLDAESPSLKSVIDSLKLLQSAGLQRKLKLIDLEAVAAARISELEKLVEMQNKKIQSLAARCLKLETSNQLLSVVQDVNQAKKQDNGKLSAGASGGPPGPRKSSSARSGAVARGRSSGHSGSSGSRAWPRVHCYGHAGR